MKKLILISMMVGLMATSAYAVPTMPTIHVDVISAYAGNILVTPNNAEGIALLGPSQFQTFCMELSENATTHTYEFAINDEAIAGGVNPAPGPQGGDPLDLRTAYLYAGVRQGWLPGYNPAAGDSKAVQYAIWYIEDEMTSVFARAQDFVNMADEAVASGRWTGTGGVVVLNLTGIGRDSGNKQDVLAIVPAPGAILLGSIGVSIVGWLRRRRTL